MGRVSIKRVFRQHASCVVTLPVWVRRGMEIEKGDYVVFQEVPSGVYVKFYKWHGGVDKEYPDYGNINLRDQGGGERNAGGAR